MYECIANDVLLVSKILLTYEEALRPKNLKISHASQIFDIQSSDFGLITTVWDGRSKTAINSP